MHACAASPEVHGFRVVARVIISMIVRSPRNVLELLFACRGSIVPAIVPQLVAAVLFGCAAAWLPRYYR